MQSIRYLILLFVCVVNVNSMALKGPPLTRYDPCGLGVIHFDRLVKSYWQGVLHLGLYRSLIEVEIEIYFEKKVKIYGVSQNSSILSSEEGHRFLIRPRGQIPKQYIFYLALEGLGENDTDVPSVTKFAMNNVTLCNVDIKKTQTVESLDVTKKDEKYQKHICGRRSLDHTELVSVRTEAKAGDWPWHVAIFIRDNTTNALSYYCGGNIISKTAIVTAGHCVIKDGLRVTADRITVVAGTNNHKEVDQNGRQSLIVKEVVLHPNYDEQATSDLAILKVDSFRYTAYVQPICIWGPVYDKANLVGRQATVVGFGHDVDNNPSDVLRATYIMVQNDTTCLNYSPGVYGKLLNEFTFCAGYGPTSGINPRNGDSGGGLVVPVMQLDHKVSWFLRGVLSKCGVSPGQTECDPRFYVVYTDVGPHYGWIFHHSAGHCVFLNGVKIATERFIIIGGTNNFKQIRLIGRQTPLVKEVILHPNYDNPNVSTSGLAIIIVDSFKYTEYVQPICIWGPGYNGKAEMFGQTGVVMGRFVYPDNTVSDDVLKAYYMMVHDDLTCLNLLPSEYGRLLTEFTLCAGGPNSIANVKRGDSGSGFFVPVMQQDNKMRWFLRGVLSKCLLTPESQDCDPGLNSVFTDVAPHNSWIILHSGLKLSTNFKMKI